MSANVITGLAATVSVDDGASNAMQGFTNATTISIPFGDVAVIEYSTLGQSDRYIRKLEGMINPGNFSFEFLYVAADYARCDSLKGVMKNWQVVIPTDNVSSKTVTFSGILTKAEAEMKNDAVISVKCEVAISGAITIA